MELIYAVDLVGTLVFAISGVLTAIEKKFDWVGAFIFGLVTAVGGGTLRDVLIGATPVGWMRDLNYLYLIAAALPICYFFQRTILKLRKGVFLFDTIGIGLFTILGLQKTLGIGLSPTIALLMGIVSATFGGVIRDVLSSQVPLIFRKEIYASACLVGGVVFLVGEYILPTHPMNIILSISTVIVIRYLAVRRNWGVPFIPYTRAGKQ
ncbi:MAG: trimeric intracellular cation channel family protein [Bacteroidota bacterium]